MHFDPSLHALNFQPAIEPISESPLELDLAASIDAEVGDLLQPNLQLPPELLEHPDTLEHPDIKELLHHQLQRERFIARLGYQLQQSLDLDAILQTTVTQVQRLLQVDRALIYRLWADGTGSAIAEAVQPGYATVLSQTFPAEVFPKSAYKAYSEGKVRVISNIDQFDIAPCLVDFVRQFQVKAKLVVPILHWGKLWGLLILHHCDVPRDWHPGEIRLLQQLMMAVGVAIQQAILAQQTQPLWQPQMTLLDNLTDAIVVQDCCHKILFWNKGAEHLYGWSTEEAVGQQISDLFYTETSPTFARVMQTTMQRGKWQGELRQVTKAGQPVVVKSHWQLLRQEETGRLEAIMTIDSDITHQKQLETAWLRSQRLNNLSRLARGIAHDFNNLLTPILAVAQLLPLKHPTLDPQSQQLLKILEQNAHRGAGLAKQILSFSNDGTGKRIFVSVKSLLLEIQQFIQPTFPKSIQIQFDIASDLWFTFADPVQLHQVFMDLCLQALNRSSDKGSIYVSATNFHLDQIYARSHSPHHSLEISPGRYVLVTIADTSPDAIADTSPDTSLDVTPAHLELPSAPLTSPLTASIAPTDAEPHVGLQLSMMREVIKSYGGLLQVSREVGKGSTVQVYLLVSEEPTAPPSQACLNHLTGDRQLILVVDDEAAICDSITSTLTAYNYRVLTAQSGIDAIALYVEHRSDISVVLLDLVMPTLDGSTTLLALQRLNPEVQVLVMSGAIESHTANQTTINQTIQQAAVPLHFLPKPFATQDLLQTLHQVLHSES